MNQSPSGVLPIVKLDAFALAGRQSPSRSFFGPKWGVSSPAALEARGVFDSGGYLQGVEGDVGEVDEAGVVIWIFENGHSEPLLFSMETLHCQITLQRGDQAFVHVGNKNGRPSLYTEFVAYRPPRLCEVPFILIR